jgi:hypothetical protein
MYSHVPLLSWPHSAPSPYASSNDLSSMQRAGASYGHLGTMDSAVSNMVRYTSSHMQLSGLGHSNPAANKSTVSMASLTGEARAPMLLGTCLLQCCCHCGPSQAIGQRARCCTPQDHRQSQQRSQHQQCQHQQHHHNSG